VGVIATDVGELVLRFFPDTAPGHVENFKALARARFYDGTTFHRVVPGFVVQGGDPNSKDENPANDGMGDGPRRLKAEFSSLPHKRGALSMARSQHPDSASCQFFIVLEENSRTRALDGKYTIFGEVLEGLDTLDRILAASQPIDMGAQRPAKPVVMRKVRIEKRPVPLKAPR
jgi:peptidyl-prolyl cis-trans isomerase B (cyclophilin B)